jgi:hypothetical protein
MSSIVANFQFAHMNTALGRIEESTRGALNVLALNGAESILGSTKGTWQMATFINDRIVQLMASGIGVYNAAGDGGLRLAVGNAGGGGATTILNMDGASFIGFRDIDAFLDEMAKKLKQRGCRWSWEKRSAANSKRSVHSGFSGLSTSGLICVEPCVY